MGEPELVLSARFIASAPSYSKLPDLGLPEIAFVGRSNVGKSSLIATLTGQNKLVRVSKTPGRTQMLNLFAMSDRWALVDLPGYGYARLSKTQRQSMERMIFSYIGQREQLNAVVLLLDARREKVTADDIRMVECVRESERALLVVATKIDLIAKNHRLTNISRLRKQLGLPKGEAVVCSSKTGEGKNVLKVRLTGLFQQ